MDDITPLKMKLFISSCNANFLFFKVETISIISYLVVGAKTI